MLCVSQDHSNADSLMQSDLIFFEIRSESLNKSAMSCCSFVGIYCCVYANVMNSARMQFLVGCYYGAESETDLPLAAKKRQTEVINKLSFQIIGA